MQTDEPVLTEPESSPGTRSFTKDPASRAWAISLLLRGRAPALLLLTLLAVNSAVFLAGRTLLPMGSVALISPPYGYKGSLADGNTTLDPWAAVNGGYASDLYTKRAIQEGSLPLWNPYQGLGQPFLANGLSYIFYPINWLHLLLPHRWWDLVFLANWYLAAVFLWMYLTLLGVPRAPALVGAVAVFASGFFQGYLAVRELPAAATWWPLLLYGTERAMREPAWRWRHLVLTLAVYATVTGGHPEASLLSLFSALVYGVVRLGGQRPLAWTRLVAVVPGAAAGLLLGAPEWVNFAQYAFTSFSLHPAGGPAGRASLSPPTFAAYVFPNLYGRILTHPFGVVPGWNWNLSPGWFPPVVAFLALMSLASARRGRVFGVYFLWTVAAVSAAKIWGVPGIDLLGQLPLFDRVGFPRFASFLLALSGAGLAGIGTWVLCGLESRRWKIWVFVWLVVMAGVLGAGLVPLRPAMTGGALSGGGLHTLLIFAGLGLLWAVAAPLGLWWVASRRPGEPLPLCWVAALGLLLHGGAVACNGYTLTTYSTLSIASLALYGASALALGAMRRTAVGSTMLAAGLSLVALPTLLATFSSHSLSTRYDILTRPPFLTVLDGGPAANLHRSFSLDSAFQANFALPFAISSLNVLEAVLPNEAVAFVQDRLDSGNIPLLFLGDPAGLRDIELREEFWRNKRYFDLVGVRYLVTRRASPKRILFQTGTSRQNPVPTPLSQPLELSFVCPTDSLSTVAVLLRASPRRREGTVWLEIVDDDGVALRRGMVDGAAIRNNAFNDFRFLPLRGLKDRLCARGSASSRSSPVPWWPPSSIAMDRSRSLRCASPSHVPISHLSTTIRTRGSRSGRITTHSRASSWRPSHAPPRRGEMRRTVCHRRRTWREKSGSSADRIWRRHRPRAGVPASGWGSN